MARILERDDYKLFESLVSLTQKEMHRMLSKYVKARYTKYRIHKDYIVGIGDIPIALVAHMDTVYKTPVKNLYYDEKKGTIWSPEGLGADDRAGIFAIIKIIESGLRPSVIFTTDEEVGGLGASALSEKECPIPNLKYLIQLDRRGMNDCVFYECHNPLFTEYIESFGFIEQYGSFSDISFLCPEWEICGVNLSVGYFDEHSVIETLYVPALLDTIKKVKTMLKANDIPTFEYKELPSSYSRWFRQYCGYDEIVSTETDLIFCENCNHLFGDYEVIPVKGADGTTKFYCPDCIVGHVDWCEKCREPYEIKGGTPAGLCEDCIKKENKSVDVQGNTGTV